MPCPNCNNTLQNLGVDQPGRRVFWCSNCGTLKWESHPPDAAPFVDVDTPQVTRRLADDREFVAWETEFRERRARMGIPRPPVV